MKLHNVQGRKRNKVKRIEQCECVSLGAPALKEWLAEQVFVCI